MANHAQMKQTVLEVLAPAAPPTTVTSLMIFGYPLETWVLIGNAIYIVVAIAAILYKTFWRKDGK
jgi:uncharacterized membrane protein